MGSHEVLSYKPSLRMQAAELFGDVQRASELGNTEAGQAAHRDAVISAFGIMVTAASQGNNMLDVVRSFTIPTSSIGREVGSVFREAALVVRFVAGNPTQLPQKK